MCINTYWYARFRLFGINECLCFPSWSAANNFHELMSETYGTNYETVSLFSRDY